MNNIAHIFENDFETLIILKELSSAHRFLGELKGLCRSIPNPAILIDTLSLQEAQDSSAIENIIITQDDIFKSKLRLNTPDMATKEVNNYVEALSYCYKQLGKNNLISVNTIIKTQKIIKDNEAGVRVQLGTTLKNEITKEVIYTPPDPSELRPLLKDLEQFINDDKTQLDPLIKMAIIHHQFESIHPFSDGNGRVGRIINILYLVQQGLLDMPVLYLSRYINHNKSGYYRLLQAVRDDNAWQDWVVFMLKAVTRTAKSSLILIRSINELQQEYKHKIRNDFKKIYSQDLLNSIFKHPYTKITFLQQDLGVSRLTANRYLEQLTTGGLLIKHKLGRENYYLNYRLVDLLSKVENMKDDN